MIYLKQKPLFFSQKRKVSKHGSALQVSAWIVSALLIAHMAEAKNDARLYRYTNDKGEKEISQRIPPKYAPKGYDIINRSGFVIQTVPPAPTKEEIAKRQREQNAIDEYLLLKRRYSTAKDIEGAKIRKLESINTSIAILESSISSLKQSIDEKVLEAAQIERAGRAVPKSLLKKIEETKAELVISTDLLNYRAQEIGEVTTKFDHDIRVYNLGQSIAERRASLDRGNIEFNSGQK